MESVLIVGCGYIGGRVAALLQARAVTVTGLVHSDKSAQGLRDRAVRVLQADLDDAEPGVHWAAGFTDIFYFAPPPPQGETDARMAAFLQALDTHAPPRRIVYISTSAVYGDCQGRWITEDEPVNPATARGQRRLDAENRLRAWAEGHEVQWIILRVPGIYGPGKLPLARLRAGTPVLREADAPYTNRIHGDDLASICVAAMDSTHANTLYNVSDGHPGNMTDYFFRVADAAGLPRPPEVARTEAEQVLTPGMLSFLQDSRRMNNEKLLAELRIELKYRDLDAGLKSCFE
jgi:nucleoside-diphosphate-sugar epimerase